MAQVSVEETTTKKYTLTERLYLNKDKSAVVKEGDLAAAFLFGGVGAEVSEEDVEKYGLLSAPDVEEDAAIPHLPEDRRLKKSPKR